MRFRVTAGNCGGAARWSSTTFGGDRIEMPIDLAPSNAVAVLASVYNIRGQLVLRSEMDLIGRTDPRGLPRLRVRSDHLAR